MPGAGHELDPGSHFGAIGWVAVHRAAKNPAGLLRWPVPVVAVVSSVPDLALLGGDTPGKGVVACRRVLPLPVP
jgi:hypothetical protein